MCRNAANASFKLAAEFRQPGQDFDTGCGIATMPLPSFGTDGPAF